MKKTFLLFTMVGFCFGCSLYQIESDSVTFGRLESAKKSARDIQYLETVSKPHTVIGTIKVNSERNQKFEAVLEKLKTEAAVLGADAITNIQTNTGTGTWARIKPKNLMGNANIRLNYVADAIIFDQEIPEGIKSEMPTPSNQGENLK